MAMSLAFLAFGTHCVPNYPKIAKLSSRRSFLSCSCAFNYTD